MKKIVNHDTNEKLIKTNTKRKLVLTKYLTGPALKKEFVARSRLALKKFIISSFDFGLARP